MQNVSFKIKRAIQGHTSQIKVEVKELALVSRATYVPGISLAKLGIWELAAGCKFGQMISKE